MGLDTSLYKQELKTELEQVFDNLIEAEEEKEEILYWRKNYNLLAWFRENLCDIGNTQYYEVPRKVFERWLEDLENDKLFYENDEKCREARRDIDMIIKILKETDFKKTKFLFYNWW